jgi:hypothetical protein
VLVDLAGLRDGTGYDPFDRVAFTPGDLTAALDAQGFAIGELFDFGPLARACRRAGHYEFLFASVPLNVAGAVGSPANAVAIL